LTKACVAEKPGNRLYCPRLNARYRTACEQLTPAIRSGWRSLLLSDPAWSENFSAPLLDALQENVIEELWSTLKSSAPAHGARPGNLIEFPSWPQGECRVGPLMVFLGRGKRVLESAAREGEKALVDVPAAELDRQRDELLLAFDVVTQREIERICGHCPQGTGCPLRGRRPS
jgi:hypothetical protein